MGFQSIDQIPEPQLTHTLCRHSGVLWRILGEITGASILKYANALIPSATRNYNIDHVVISTYILSKKVLAWQLRIGLR
jgi:hypothetical protein